MDIAVSNFSLFTQAIMSASLVLRSTTKRTERNTRLEAPNEIRFYGRNYPAHREFSNFYLVNLQIDGKEWDSVEHYYQAMKTADPDEQEDIRVGYKLGTTQGLRIGMLKADNLTRDSSPGFSKKQGRDCQMRENWEDMKEDVMRKALQAKFSRPDLRAKLLLTGDALLIEASPTDYYWGEGAAKIGKNRLGVLLVELRGKLKEDAKTNA